MLPCRFGAKCGHLRRGRCEFLHTPEEISQARAASDGVQAGPAGGPERAAATGQQQEAPAPRARSQTRSHSRGGVPSGACYVCGKPRKDHPDDRFCSPPERGPAPEPASGGGSPKPCAGIASGTRGSDNGGRGDAGMCLSDLGAPLGASDSLHSLREHLMPGATP